MRSTEEPQTTCLKRNKRALTLFCSEQHSEDPCHPGIQGGLSRVTQAYAAHAPAQQQKRTAVQDRWILVGLSAQSLENLTSKETTILATQPTLSFPHKRKKQTKQQQQMQAITQELYHEVQADCRFGPCPAPHPRTLIMKLEVLLTC